MLRNNDTSLKELSLEKNKMGNAGITKVAAALLGNSVLTELNVKRNAIGNEGAAKVAQMLAGNSVQLLTRLYLERNDIGGQGASSIAEALVSNSMLTIPTNEKTPLFGNVSSAAKQVLRLFVLAQQQQPPHCRPLWHPLQQLLPLATFPPPL